MRKFASISMVVALAVVGCGKNDVDKQKPAEASPPTGPENAGAAAPDGEMPSQGSAESSEIDFVTLGFMSSSMPEAVAFLNHCNQSSGFLILWLGIRESLFLAKGEYMLSCDAKSRKGLLESFDALAEPLAKLAPKPGIVCDPLVGSGYRSMWDISIRRGDATDPTRFVHSGDVCQHTIRAASSEETEYLFDEDDALLNAIGLLFKDEI